MYPGFNVISQLLEDYPILWLVVGLVILFVTWPFVRFVVWGDKEETRKGLLGMVGVFLMLALFVFFMVWT